MKLWKLASAATALVLSTSVNSAIVTMGTNSTITSVTGSVFDEAAAGDQISLQFTYETTTPVSYSDYDFIEYSNSNPFSIGFSTGDIALSWDSLINRISVSNDVYVGTGQHYDSLWMSSTNATSTNTVAGLMPVRVDLSFGDDINCNSAPCYPGNIVPMLSSNSLPDENFNYQDGRLSLWFTSTSGSADATIFFDASSATNLSTVPVPAALWLFGSGLIGLVSFARRK